MNTHTSQAHRPHLVCTVTEQLSSSFPVCMHDEPLCTYCRHLSLLFDVNQALPRLLFDTASPTCQLATHHTVDKPNTCQLDLTTIFGNIHNCSCNVYGYHRICFGTTANFVSAHSAHACCSLPAVTVSSRHVTVPSRCLKPFTDCD